MHHIEIESAHKLRNSAQPFRAHNTTCQSSPRSFRQKLTHPLSPSQGHAHVLLCLARLTCVILYNRARKTVAVVSGRGLRRDDIFRGRVIRTSHVTWC